MAPALRAAADEPAFEFECGDERGGAAALVGL